MRDARYLLPDNYETIKATEILAKEGFVVMPTCIREYEYGKRYGRCGSRMHYPSGRANKPEYSLVREMPLHRGHAGSAPDCGDGSCPTLAQQTGLYATSMRTRLRQILRE